VAGSPLVNAGSNPAGLTFDQRGFARVVGPAADIGAFELQTVPPVTVSSLVVNGGVAQRSMVTAVAVTFSGLVTFPAGPASAFSLVGPSGAVSLVVDLRDSTATQTVARVTFTGTGIIGGSVADGNYTFTVLGSQVRDTGGQLLDGDGNGTPGGDRVATFHRLYGDADGSRNVDTLDLFRVYGTFGKSPTDPGFLAYFDFDGSGTVDTLDLFRFYQRFGTSLV
jgi:hypothetical protein